MLFIDRGDDGDDKEKGWRGKEREPWGIMAKRHLGHDLPTRIQNTVHTPATSLQHVAADLCRREKHTARHARASRGIYLYTT